jgi:hypothetical protein
MLHWLPGRYDNPVRESTISSPSHELRIWPLVIYSEEMEQRLAVILLASLASVSVASAVTRSTGSNQQGCDMSSRAQKKFLALLRELKPAMKWG